MSNKQRKTMAISVPDNSYCTVAEADAFFLTRMFSELWAPFVSKEAALYSSFRYMNGFYDWYEEFTAPVDPAIIEGQLEIAYFMLSQHIAIPGEGFPATSIKSANLVAMTFDESRPYPRNSLISIYVSSLLKPFGSRNDLQIPVTRGF